MYDKTSNLMERFDELFNDHFIATATDEDIDSRFEYLKNLCARDQLNFNELLEELESHCNSYIAKQVSHN